MANEIVFEQRYGGNGPRVLRSVTPAANQVLGFDANSKISALSPSVTRKGIVFTENATSLTYTATVAIPAGATLHDIQIDAGALWGAGTATMTVGDTADDDGYFTGVNLKATDLLVGEQLRIGSSVLWGGKEGVYLVAATGRRGPVASNFGGKYVAGSNILITVTTTAPAATAGRTYATVTYSQPDVVVPVLA